MEKPFLIDLKYFGDERGFFCEVWREKEFQQITGVDHWEQANWSRSSKGILRGLHFQMPPHAQAKSVWVTRGLVKDVCVDIRGNSPDFGKVYSFELNGDKPQILFVPKGFAHGYCTLSESVDFMYLCSSLYAPEAESGILWNDPALKIDWPKLDFKLSDRDQKWAPLSTQASELKKIQWS